jgi:hypothetical protein
VPKYFEAAVAQWQSTPLVRERSRVQSSPAAPFAKSYPDQSKKTHNENGIGRKFISAVISEAIERTIERTYDSVTLTTDHQIPWNYPFYKRLGFKEVDLDKCPPFLASILLRDKSTSAHLETVWR